MAYEVLVGLDDSGSMQEALPNGVKRIDAAKELAGAVIRKACQWDKDGPELWVFGHAITSLGNVTVDDLDNKLAALTAEQTQTRTGELLTAMLKRAYDLLTADSSKHVLLLIVTDGVPNPASERQSVKDQIISFTKWMQRDDQCAIEFVAIGNQAAGYLKELDDDLQKQGAKFDIVDATPVEEAMKMDAEELFDKAFND